MHLKRWKWGGIGGFFHLDGKQRTYQPISGRALYGGKRSRRDGRMTKGMDADDAQRFYTSSRGFITHGLQSAIPREWIARSAPTPSFQTDWKTPINART